MLKDHQSQVSLRSSQGCTVAGSLPLKIIQSTVREEPVPTVTEAPGAMCLPLALQGAVRGTGKKT